MNQTDINIQRAADLAKLSGYQQVIIFAHDGEQTIVTTWGDTAEHSAQAAAGANAIKKQWSWPADTIAESAKVTQLQTLVKQLALVHVIQCTEYERGWGSRNEGYMAFMSETAAKKFCSDYDAQHNTASTAPDWYMKWSYDGTYTCSLDFLTKVLEKHQVPFNRMSELQS